jgi:hypothetical protein
LILSHGGAEKRLPEGQRPAENESFWILQSATSLRPMCSQPGARTLSGQNCAAGGRPDALQKDREPNCHATLYCSTYASAELHSVLNGNFASEATETIAGQPVTEIRSRQTPSSHPSDQYRRSASKRIRKQSRPANWLLQIFSREQAQCAAITLCNHRWTRIQVRRSPS